MAPPRGRNSLRFIIRKAWEIRTQTPILSSSIIARHRVGQKVRKKVWDDMEVKGRSINGIQDQITVQNYPMAPMTFEEQDTLEEVLKERELSKKVFSTAGELTGNVPSLPPRADKPPGQCLKIIQNVPFRVFQFWHFPPILFH